VDVLAHGRAPSGYRLNNAVPAGTFVQPYMKSL
jgi:hypothetical protein